ncbi:hypothetical protein HCR15_03385 [Wolbachia pipientis]|nr:hypothetical protein [Wolbachia pipientis]
MRIQLEITTPKYNKYWGYATTTHPFHPWKGQSFQISSTKKSDYRDILKVRVSTDGTIAIPRDWTDKADPDPYKTLTSLSPILSFSHLQELVKLIRSNVSKKEVD